MEKCIFIVLINCVNFLFVPSVFCGFPSGQTHPFRVYWNVPTQSCKAFGVDFELSRYNIIQNTGDVFYGDKVGIIYRPGAFPYFKGQEAVNGGIPQKGDLGGHLKTFKKQVDQRMPQNFSGVAILDFEDYQPSLALAPKIYKKYSFTWSKSKNPGKDEEFIEAFSQRTFNDTSKKLFQILVEEGRALRPGAIWGYYHYPYCKNDEVNQLQCYQQEIASNSAMIDLFSSFGAFYPSIYTFKQYWNPHRRCLQSSSRVREAQRVKGRSNNRAIKILPYFWYRYHDDAEYLSPADIMATLGISRSLQADGAVIWGSKQDVSSREKCVKLKKYIDVTLGPIVRNLTSSDPVLVKCQDFDPGLPPAANAIWGESAKGHLEKGYLYSLIKSVYTGIYSMF